MPGRAIHHQVLAGLVARIYGIDDNAIFDAIGSMLCGKPVASGPAPVPREGDAPVFMLIQ